MTSVGATLRSERLRRNLSLDQISRELKIAGRFLEAIETEHFERLPGGLFAKSFVRQYARLLDLDDQDLADQVQRALEPQPEVPPLAGNPGLSEFRPKMAEFGESRFGWPSGALPAGALLVVALLVCSG